MSGWLSSLCDNLSSNLQVSKYNELNTQIAMKNEMKKIENKKFTIQEDISIFNEIIDNLDKLLLTNSSINSMKETEDRIEMIVFELENFKVAQ